MARCCLSISAGQQEVGGNVDDGKPGRMLTLSTFLPSTPGRAEVMAEASETWSCSGRQTLPAQDAARRDLGLSGICEAAFLARV